ncbi:MAG: hypothetical protein IK095_10260 [Oscillospiraceae bacterium]|nr:hypothetical protein [Oscillospiraceae bacterium]
MAERIHFDWRGFCRQVFEQEKKLLLVDEQGDIRLKMLSIPSVNNGWVRLSRPGKKKRVIGIDPWKTLHARDTSETMKRFFLYSTVVHELAHVQLWDLLQKRTASDLFALLAALDQLGGSSLDLIEPAQLGNKGKDRFSRLRYLASAAELYCDRIAAHHALGALRGEMTEEERKRAEAIISSLDLIAMGLQITYSQSGQALDLFVSVLRRVRVIKRSKKLRELVDLGDIFDERGDLPTPEQMFERLLSGQPLFGELLLNAFIHIDGDWEGLFERNEQLRETMRELADSFSAKAQDYLKNTDICLVFLPEAAVRDNSAMLLHNVRTLNRKMRDAKMPHECGGLMVL